MQEVRLVMQFIANRSNTGRLAVCVLAASFALAFVAVSDAAAKKPRNKKSEGKLIEFVADANLLKVKEKGKEREYRVKLEGSVLDRSRTTVKMNGMASPLEKVPKGAPLIVYWIPDGEDGKGRFATLIDAPRVPEDLLDDF